MKSAGSSGPQPRCRGADGPDPALPETRGAFLRRLGCIRKASYGDRALSTGAWGFRPQRSPLGLFVLNILVRTPRTEASSWLFRKEKKKPKPNIPIMLNLEKIALWISVQQHTGCWRVSRALPRAGRRALRRPQGQSTAPALGLRYLYPGRCVRVISSGPLESGSKWGF